MPISEHNRKSSLRLIPIRAILLNLLVFLAVAVSLGCNGPATETSDKSETNPFTQSLGGRPQLEPKVATLAVGSTKALLSPDGTSDAVGLNISIANAPTIAGIQYQLRYDPTLLQFEELHPSESMTDFIFEADADTDRGIVSAVAITHKGVDISGTIAVVWFKPIREGLTEIRLENVILANDQIESVETDRSPGQVQITSDKSIDTRVVSEPTEIPRRQTGRDATTVPNRPEPTEIPRRQTGRDATTVPNRPQPTEIPRRQTGRDATTVPNRPQPTEIPRRQTGRDATTVPSRR